LLAFSDGEMGVGCAEMEAGSFFEKVAARFGTKSW
jgi:hypothetical protein